MTGLTEAFNHEHVIAPGSRVHVISYSGVKSRKRFGRLFSLNWCSEPFCERNRPAVLRCIEEGHDPASLAPSLRLKNWLRSEAGRRALAEQEKAR